MSDREDRGPLYGGERRRARDVQLEVLDERLNNLMDDNLVAHQVLTEDLKQLRSQTHDWMQAMLNRLPPWAVWVGMLSATAMGAMVMFIITHSWK